jgi:2-polyprenyl-3-methyl-5-hydroxy-6-metoxy-1,4-benzoquinol methylase
VKLNNCHHYFEKSINEKLNNESKDKTHQPPYLQQTIMIKILQENNIIQKKPILDYASGYGTLHNILEKYFSINSLIFDPYIRDKSEKYISKEDLGKYKTVLNSAMFEHIRSRQDINNVNSLVDEDGCFILHTLVCENVPCDNNWFYLTPVHCAFHTNRSMQILMEQWNYKSSIYCPSSKCWVLLKNERVGIKDKIIKINKEFQENYLFYKKGFVDYWKGF